MSTARRRRATSRRSALGTPTWCGPCSRSRARRPPSSPSSSTTATTSCAASPTRPGGGWRSRSSWPGRRGSCGGSGVTCGNCPTPVSPPVRGSSRGPSGRRPRPGRPPSTRPTACRAAPSTAGRPYPPPDLYRTTRRSASARPRCSTSGLLLPSTAGTRSPPPSGRRRTGGPQAPWTIGRLRPPIRIPSPMACRRHHPASRGPNPPTTGRTTPRRPFPTRAAARRPPRPCPRRAARAAGDRERKPIDPPSSIDRASARRLRRSAVSAPASSPPPVVRVQAGTTAGAAVRAAGLPSNGPSAVVVVRADGTLRDLAWSPDADVDVEPVAADTEDGRSVIRHSAAHVLAQAVQQLRPDAKLGIGPPITDGFYYDFDVDKPFTPEDLTALEAAMKKIIKAGQRFSRRRFDSVDDARKELADEPYKLELIDLKEIGRAHV